MKQGIMITRVDSHLVAFIGDPNLVTQTTSQGREGYKVYERVGVDICLGGVSPHLAKLLTFAESSRLSSQPRSSRTIGQYIERILSAYALYFLLQAWCAP